jgi:hypothetical protein
MHVFCFMPFDHDESRNSKYILPENTAATAVKDHTTPPKRYYDLSVQWCAIIDKYISGEMHGDDTKLFHLLRLREPLPEYAKRCPSNLPHLD